MKQPAERRYRNNALVYRMRRKQPQDDVVLNSLIMRFCCRNSGVRLQTYTRIGKTVIEGTGQASANLHLPPSGFVRIAAGSSLPGNPATT